jgi:predicted dehydrogenase
MIRVAMLSFWHVHARDYLRQATNNPGTEVVAVWDEEPDRGKAKAAEIGVEFVPDLDTLLARDDVDAVINDVPTNIHRDVLVKAARAGKHIFSEKVLAATLAEANEILAAVDEAGVVLTLSLPRLYHAYTQTVDEVLASGRLGQLTLARVRLSHGGALANWLPDHFYVKEQTLGGALIDLGCHPMYLTAKFLGGLPDTVSATFGHVTGREVEDSAVAVLSYPNGAIGVAEAGFVNKMNPFEIEIHGTEGSLFFGTPEAKLRVRAAGDDGFVEVPIGDPLPMAFDQWVEAVENGGKTEENVAHGLSLTKLMDAASRSAASGQAVTVADLPA